MTQHNTQGRPGQQQSPRDKPFYTDMGRDVTLRDSEDVTTHLPRYAVWKWDEAKGKPQVEEVSDDLEALRAEHGEGPLVDLMRPANPD
jgi:hypothetical protein